MEKITAKAKGRKVGDPFDMSVEQGPQVSQEQCDRIMGYIDAGKKDEWFLDLGAEGFRAGLARIGVPEERIYFELFEGTHMAIDYRYPMALSWLAHRLAR